MTEGGFSFRRVLCALALVAAAGRHAAATTWGVPGDGSNTCTVATPSCDTIAQAIAASSNTDTIQIGAGTFAAPNLLVTKTLTIEGAGMASTFVQPGAGATAFSIRADGIVIRDLAIQNGTTGAVFQITSDNTEFTRVHFTGNTSRGIDISTPNTSPVTNVRVVDCTFATANASGIRMASNSRVTGLSVSGSTFTGNNIGIYQANDGNTSRLTTFNVTTSQFTGNVFAAIYLEEVRDGVIEDSTFTGNGYGVLLFKAYSGSGVGVANLTIRDNQFTDGTNLALDLQVFGLALESPITVENNVITQNVGLWASNLMAIDIALGRTQTHAAVSLIGNTITLSGTLGTATAVHGVLLRGNGPVVLTDNVIDGGHVGGSGTTPPSSGVFVQARTSNANYGQFAVTGTVSASCNRIGGFTNGVSVFDTVGATFGGLDVGTSVSFTSNVIADNDGAGIVTGAAAPTIGAENNYWGCPTGPGTPGCDGVTGNVDADPFATTVPACIACVANAECSDGLFCNGAETCNVGTGACEMASDPCAGGLDCENLCNEATDDCFVPAGTVCRPAVDACDIAETCSGSGGACPADTGLPDADGDAVCDASDNCDAIANPTQANGDADALGDACDPCTNVVPTGQEKVKLTLTKLLAPAGDDKVSFKGFFTNVPTIPTIDPVANGMRFLIVDSTGAIPVDVTIPGGAYNTATKAGWKVNGSGTSWTYKNSGKLVPLVNGITKMQLKKMSSPPGKYKFSVKGKDGTYPVNPANLPLVGTLVIDTPFAETGQCGEATWPAVPPAKPSCLSASGGKTIKCK